MTGRGAASLWRTPSLPGGDSKLEFPANPGLDSVEVKPVDPDFG